MQPPAVGIKEGHDVEGRDLCIERLGILEIVVSDLVNDIAKEFGDATFGHLLTGIVIEAGLMGGLCLNADNCRGVVGDVFVVEGEAGGLDELGVAMFGFVLGGLLKDGHEGMDTFQLFIRNDNEKGEKGLPDGKEVVIGWLPFEGEEGVVSLFEEAGDCLWSHCLGFTRELGEFRVYSQTRGVFFLARGAGRVL
jgi:hypothetical protein